MIVVDTNVLVYLLLPGEHTDQADASSAGTRYGRPPFSGGQSFAMCSRSICDRGASHLTKRFGSWTTPKSCCRVGSIRFPQWVYSVWSQVHDAPHMMASSWRWPRIPGIVIGDL